MAKSFTLPLTACILHQSLTKTGLVKPNGHKRTRIPKVKLIQLRTISLLGNNADLINLKKKRKKRKLLLLSFFACHLYTGYVRVFICRYYTLKKKKLSSLDRTEWWSLIGIGRPLSLISVSFLFLFLCHETVCDRATCLFNLFSELFFFNV